MGPGLMAVVSATISTATVSVAVGVAVLAVNPSPVSSTTAVPPAAVASQAATTGSRFVVAGPTSPAFDITSLSPGIAALAADVLTVAVPPDPTETPAVFDTNAMDVGLAGSGYAFTMRIDGFSGLSALGTTVRGTATDATHYTLEFPESAVLTRYVRNGESAAARVSGHDLAVAPGQTLMGDLSPEALTPAHVLAAIAEPWAATLKPTGAPGTYEAATRALVLAAQHEGYAATDWSLSAVVDATGRLMSLTFTGYASGAPFTLKIAIGYH